MRTSLIGGWTVPMWMCWAGPALAGFLAYTAFSMKGSVPKLKRPLNNTRTTGRAAGVKTGGATMKPEDCSESLPTKNWTNPVPRMILGANLA